jgi:hypothetical protein
MEKLYFVTRVNLDAEGKQSNSIQMFVDEVAARKRYYTLLASDIDSDRYTYEMVQIVREDGICIESQVFDRRSVPGMEG